MLLLTLLLLKGIFKSFPVFYALINSCLSVFSVRAFPLMRENGAGKSTLMKVISGINSKDAGTIEYLGKKVTFTSPNLSPSPFLSLLPPYFILLFHLPLPSL
ncbi:ATP-binding cassette domain-containing protein, partial [Pasteurella multocida]|uniref:ATP-binding cassette domain-containing protein n=1 Tax=Pasteurella multocida TaxID=747 RepID=UPI0014615F8B|nr:ATP-binding cassette domain-containing protein [Pasteurella multocida]